MEQMKARGIQTSIHYPPIHQFSAYRGNGQNGTALKNTETLAKRELTLPLFPALSEMDMQFVVEALRDSLATIDMR
jgi:dTDP-4-amino-4,6-dideoxygalactose transaminase